MIANDPLSLVFIACFLVGLIYFIVTALLGNLAAPWGVLTDFSLWSVLIGIVTVTVKILLLGTLLSVGEVFMAKVRLFRVPELLAGSFVLALLAVTASYLVA